MKKLVLLLIYSTITFPIIAQNNWLVFKAPLIPAVSLENHSSARLITKLDTFEKQRDSNSENYSILRKEHLINFNSIPANFIVCMLNDKKGNLWFGTFGGGVAKFNDSKWENYNSFNSKLPSDVIYSLAVDKYNNLWVGTVDGLAKFDGVKWNVYDKNNSRLPSNMIYSLAIDKHDNKWIGTTKGLVKLSGANWKSFNTLNSKIPHNHVTALTIDSEDKIWVGTFEGLAKFDGSNWKVFKQGNSPLPYNDIYSLTVDRKNKIYIGTWGGGLATINKSNWDVFNTKNSLLPDNYVSSILVTNNKTLIGTLNGLVKINNGNWKTFKTGNSPLPNDLIYSIVQDANGNIWVGTENGLAVYNEEGFKLKSTIEETHKRDISKVQRVNISRNIVPATNQKYSKTVEQISFEVKENRIITKVVSRVKGFLSVILENPIDNNELINRKVLLDAGEHNLEFHFEKEAANFYLLKFILGDYTSNQKILLVTP